jgi:dienelactone hydrolase
MATATRVMTYNDQETPLTGFLAWDDAVGQPLPWLLLVHGGAGLDDHAKGQAVINLARAVAVAWLLLLR